MKRVLIAILFIVADLGVAWAGGVHGPDCTKTPGCTVGVTTGSVIRIGNNHWHMCGIEVDAIDTPRGRETQQMLWGYIKHSNKPLQCVQITKRHPCWGKIRPAWMTTQGPLIVAQCFLGGEDLGEWLIRHGRAWENTKITGGMYGDYVPDKGL